jgi:AcrR family transcriptional regulator
MKRGRDRVAALKKAGALVFTLRGYDAATMTEIAVRARAPIGSLYQFFPTKESLANALLAELLDVLSEMLTELRDSAVAKPSTAAELVTRLLRRLSEFLDLHPVFIELLDRRMVDRDRRRAIRARIQNLIVALLSQAEPPLRRRRAEVIAVMILQLLRVMATLKNESSDETTAAALIELRRMLRAYLESA